MQKAKVWTIHILNNYIRRNRFLTQLIFGLTILDKSNIHWDFTTLVLKKAVRETIKHNQSVLEIGTGPYAILAIYLYKNGYHKIVASDINPDYIRSATPTASLNNADFIILQSNLFSNIKGKFDVIFFNSVYIPEKTGKDLKLYSIHNSKTHWCGGKSGTETIENFLKSAADYLLPNGKILLGFNPHYLQKQKMNKLCKLYNYRVLQETKSSIIPSIVFILEEEEK